MNGIRNKYQDKNLMTIRGNSPIKVQDIFGSKSRFFFVRYLIINVRGRQLVLALSVVLSMAGQRSTAKLHFTMWLPSSFYLGWGYRAARAGLGGKQNFTDF